MIPGLRAHSLRPLVLLCIVVGASACSGIRVVRVSKQGGEIALIGDREEAMEKARAEMSRICGGIRRFEIVEEGEVPVGYVSHSTGSGTAWGNRGMAVGIGSSTTTTQQATEWRVRFQCGAPPAEVVPVPVTPAPSSTTPAPSNEAAPPSGNQVRVHRADGATRVAAVREIRIPIR